MKKLFSHLLLATEGTEFDVGAERLALALSQQCKLPLATVMPLLSNPEYEALAPQIAANAERLAAEQIARLRALAQAQAVSISIRVRRGKEPYEEIVAEARAQGSDLIIIRRRGKRGFLANLLVGEMVSNVVAHAPCDVLIVPRAAQMWQQRVLVAAEPDAQGRRLVRTAAAAAVTCGLPLHITCVSTGDLPAARAQTFITEAVQLAHECGANAQGAVRSGKPYTEILAAATQHKADLIVIGSRSDRRIGRAMVGGVAQKVLGLSDHPVLVQHFQPPKGLAAA